MILLLQEWEELVGFVRNLSGLFFVVLPVLGVHAEAQLVLHLLAGGGVLIVGILGFCGLLVGASITHLLINNYKHSKNLIRLFLLEEKKTPHGKNLSSRKKSNCKFFVKLL